MWLFKIRRHKSRLHLVTGNAHVGAQQASFTLCEVAVCQCLLLQNLQNSQSMQMQTTDQQSTTTFTNIGFTDYSVIRKTGQQDSYSSHILLLECFLIWQPEGDWFDPLAKCRGVPEQDAA